MEQMIFGMFKVLLTILPHLLSGITVTIFGFNLFFWFYFLFLLWLIDGMGWPVRDRLFGLRIARIVSSGGSSRRLLG
jgi:hypothetical protein